MATRDGEPAEITIEQRIEWHDTDASGHHHHASILRMAEAAEAELLERLGLAEELYGSFPRVHVSADFQEPLHFRARVDVHIKVAELRRTSIAFAFVVKLEGRQVADGRVVAVRLESDGRPAPWTERQRELLLESGDLTAR
jgi:YbgC/YbaW family acyl-CoA thioester hydrolase